MNAFAKFRQFLVACAVLLGAFAPALLHAENTSVPLLDLLRALKPAPNTQAIAAREGFALRDLQTGTAGAKPKPGDQVTALVALGSLDGKLRPSQWIIRLKRVERPPAETRKVHAKDEIIYTNTGDRFAFHTDISSMDLETLGPIPNNAKSDLQIESKRRTIYVKADFLSLDLTRAAKAIAMVSNTPEKGSITTGSVPYPAAEIEVGRKFLAMTKLTPDDVRSFVESEPALFQFLDIARSTPELQGILLQVLDKPSIIDVFRNGSRDNLLINFIGGGKAEGRNIFWNDGKTGDFCILLFNIVIFGKPALSVALWVVPPAPPLQVSAGVVGLIAFSPTKPNKVVGVRALSSAPGGDAVEPALPPH
ncbi:MAG: hypothetical protein ABSA05_05175 [Opitutaceae bacterium]